MPGIYQRFTQVAQVDALSAAMWLAAIAQQGDAQRLRRLRYRGRWDLGLSLGRYCLKMPDGSVLSGVLAG